MLDTIILIVGIVSPVLVEPMGRLIDRHVRRIEEEDWRRVQEETRTKGVAVGKWKEMLERSNS